MFLSGTLLIHLSSTMGRERPWEGAGIAASHFHPITHDLSANAATVLTRTFRTIDLMR